MHCHEIGAEFGISEWIVIDLPNPAGNIISVTILNIIKHNVYTVDFYLHPSILPI